MWCVLLLAMAVPLHARRFEGRNYWGMQAYGTYALMPAGGLELSTSPIHGFAGGVGAVYENQHSLYRRAAGWGWLTQFGVGFHYSALINTLDAHHVDNDELVDTQGRNFIMHYDFWRGRQDAVRSVRLDVPLMVGLQYRSAYLLAGCKLSPRLSSVASSKSRVTLTATYERYFKDYHDMPNHALLTQDIQDRKARFGAGLQVYAAAEVGWTIFDSYDYRVTGYAQRHDRNGQALLRFALYAEYGLLNNVRQTGYDAVSINPNYPFNADAIRMHHLLLTPAAEGKYVPELNVGVKLTVLFRNQTAVRPARGLRRHVDHAPKPSRCLNCDLDAEKEKHSIDCVDCQQGQGWKQ